MADGVTAFLMQGAPVRGRTVQLGADTINPILHRHAYPRAAAMLLGEALALAALVGSLLKTAHVLTVQAEGKGPMSLLVAEWRRDGGLRGYARINTPAAVDRPRMAPAQLLGADAALAITLDQGPDTDILQGIVALEGDSLAACAERYFTVSEQTPTRVKLAVGQEVTGERPVWRAGGMLIQRVAGDDARGDTDEDWSRAQILFASLTDEELLDPALSLETPAYRLFHEEQVRFGEPGALLDRCTCNAERLRAILSRYEADELDGLRDEAGRLTATCQFCARVYDLDLPV